ncbi:MAG: hypothetical protein AAFQ51_06615, partial [Pseudomonadota bacterium]
MNRFSDPILMSAHALPVDQNEPHAQVGNHLRVATNPELGLPVAPFVVYRGFGESRKGLNTRQTANFMDKNGQPVSLPFTVTPDTPLTIEIVKGLGETCIWAQLSAVAQEDLKEPNDPQEILPEQPTNPDGPPVFEPVRPEGPILFDPSVIRPGGGAVRPTLPGVSRPNRPGRISDMLRPTLGGITRPTATSRPTATLNTDILGSVVGDFLGSGGFNRIEIPSLRIPDILIPEATPQKLTIEAFVKSAYHGLATIGRRSASPYAISGPGIEVIEVTGWGNVSSIRWIEANDPQRLQWEPYAVMNLPHPGGPRYLPIANWDGLSKDRVTAQAPKRVPLQETVNTPPPSGAPVANTAFEQGRVDSLTLTMDEDLSKLITDTGTPQLDQVVVIESTSETAALNPDGTAVPTGTATMARIDRFMQLQADPGTASRIGYKLREILEETVDRIEDDAVL